MTDEMSRRDAILGLGSIAAVLAGYSQTQDATGGTIGTYDGTETLQLGDWLFVIADTEADVAETTEPMFVWNLSYDSLQTYNLDAGMSTLTENSAVTIKTANTIADATIESYPTMVVALNTDAVALFEGAA